MKPLSLILILFVFSIALHSQQFLWAESYEISNCNEVAALAVDTSGYVFISGIHNAPSSVPYTGNCYLQKTDSEGNEIWTEYFNGSVQMGDMAAINSSVVIIGQSSGPFSYQGEEYGSEGYFMFLFMVNSDGLHQWHIIDETKFGRNTNIAVGKLGNFAVQVRGQGNLGDWVWIMNKEGDILDTKEIMASESTIVDIAYYDEWVYLNGGFNGPGSMIIDTIVINVQPIENTTFTLALDPNLVAKWVATDTTIHNFDGQIVANETGIYVFESVLEPPFTVLNYIKKFSFEGLLIEEVVAPVFSNAIALYPSLTVTPNMLGLFVKNDFNGNSHAAFLFDHDLNLISQKNIEGPSSHYSGEISNFEDDLYVGQVYSGNLIFTDEVTLPYSGTGNLPYIAKIGNPSITDIDENINDQNDILVYPNPASEKITIKLNAAASNSGTLSVTDIAGNIVSQKTIKNNLTIDINELPAGVYLFQVQLNDGSKIHEKIIIL